MDHKELKPVGRVSGVVEISGAKNSALLLLAATVLLKKPVLFYRMPDISDVRNMCDLLALLNVKVRWLARDSLYVDPTHVRYQELCTESCGEIRTSVLFLGVLLGKYRQACLKTPGGCHLGPRPIDFHVGAMRDFGAQVVLEGTILRACLEAVQDTDIIFKRSSVTATVNAMLCGVSLPTTTRIHQAAKEPEIDDLIQFLQLAGGDVQREAGDIVIRGGQDLQLEQYKVMPDRIEAGTFLIAATILQGSVTVTEVVPQHMTALLSALRQAGASVEIGDKTITLMMNRRPLPVDIEAKEYPEFPTDLQPQWCVLACLANGSSRITDHIFSERFDHMDELAKKGAKFTYKANGVEINGVDFLEGSEVYAKNLRSAAALVLSGLVARGKSKIIKISVLNRGYPGFFLKINNILSN